MYIKLPNALQQFNPIIQVEAQNTQQVAPQGNFNSNFQVLSLVSTSDTRYTCLSSRWHLSQDMFPFLPLPADFDPLDDEAWQALLQNIELYLVQILDSPGKRRTLMCELFWMAYMAVCPTFPFGDWPNWDSRIPLEGNFVSYWMAQLDLPYVIVRCEHLSVDARQLIWEKLTALVHRSFPPPLI